MNMYVLNYLCMIVYLCSGREFGEIHFNLLSGNVWIFCKNTCYSNKLKKTQKGLKKNYIIFLLKTLEVLVYGGIL